MIYKLFFISSFSILLQTFSFNVYSFTVKLHKKGATAISLPSNVYCADAGGLCWEKSNGTPVSWFGCADLPATRQFYCNPSYISTWGGTGITRANCSTPVTTVSDFSAGFTANCTIR